MAWRDHTVIAVIIAGAASIGFYIQFFQPVLTKDKDNQIAEQTKSIAALNQTVGGLKQQIVTLEADKAAAEKLTQTYVARNAMLSNAGMFRDLPYPKGLGALHVHDNFSAVSLKAAYPTCTVNQPQAGVATVDCSKNAEFFANLTYFYWDGYGYGKRNEIYRIEYEFKKIGVDSEAVAVAQLQETIGSGQLIEDKNKSSPWWEVADYHGLHLRLTPVGYEVMERGAI